MTGIQVWITCLQYCLFIYVQCLKFFVSGGFEHLHLAAKTSVSGLVSTFKNVFKVFPSLLGFARNPKPASSNRHVLLWAGKQSDCSLFWLNILVEYLGHKASPSIMMRCIAIKSRMNQGMPVISFLLDGVYICYWWHREMGYTFRCTLRNYHFSLDVNNVPL